MIQWRLVFWWNVWIKRLRFVYFQFRIEDSNSACYQYCLQCACRCRFLYEVYWCWIKLRHSKAYYTENYRNIPAGTTTLYQRWYNGHTSSWNMVVFKSCTSVVISLCFVVLASWKTCMDHLKRSCYFKLLIW